MAETKICTTCNNDKPLTEFYIHTGVTLRNSCKVCHNAKYKHSKFYLAWINIKTRCYNKNMNQSKDYIGRSIKLCDKWNSFEGFKEDMYSSFLKHQNNHGNQNTSIDRIDNNGNYCKQNCRWATAKEQANNTRKTIFLTFEGETQSLNTWAELLGLNRNTLHTRLRRRWSIERTLTTKVN